MSLGGKMKFLREEMNLDRQQLADAVGITYHALAKYETDERQPDYETLTKLADFLGVSVDYFLGRTDVRGINTVERPKLREEFLRIMKDQGGSLPYSALIKLVNKMLPSEKNKPRILPVLGSIRAGLPILTDEHIEDILEVPDHIIADYALRVQGDSMAGAGILDGDLAICKETQVAQPGQIVVALNDLSSGYSEATLKYFFNGSGDNPVLRAANPEYQDIKIVKGYRIAGVMVALIRENSPSYQVYKEFLTIKNYEEWTEVIEKATGYDITPEQLLHNLDMQWRMIERMRKNKKNI